MAHVVNELEELIRQDVLRKLGDKLHAELLAMPLSELLVVYFNWRERYPVARPRVVHLSRELLASPSYQKYSLVIDEIIRKIERGDDLMPHLSERITTVYTPIAERRPSKISRKDLDLLAAEWGLVHLHLSTNFKVLSPFVERTDDLLFAGFTPRDAFLVTVLPHLEWTNLALVEIMVRNWPNSGFFSGSLSGLRLAAATVQSDLKPERDAGLTTMLEIDGVLYAPRGQSTAGTPIAATDKSNRIMHTLHTLGDRLTSYPEEYKSVVGGETNPTWDAWIHDNSYGLRDAITGRFIPQIPVLE